ncbi:MAG TPA: redoxin domain-containing protein [bacterium]|nr:redoxin domain-containing protein [bacterium]
MKCRHLLSQRALAFFCLGLAGLWLVSTQSGAASSKPAPDFVVTDLVKGDTLRLAGLDSHPVLLFFYDGADMAGVNALPYVNEWDRRYEGDGLQVIGIHSPALEQMKIRYNAVEILSRAKVSFPVGADSDRAIYRAYSLSALPTYILMKPGREIVYQTSKPLAYAETETAIQKLLAEKKPGMVNPFLVRPLRPIDDPKAKVIPATPQVNLGYQYGSVADCDSAAYDKLRNFTDSGERQKGKVYLQGYWKVGPNSVAYEAKYRSSDDHLRIIYSGKSVWLLPCFPYAAPGRVYVKQDREYLLKPYWGKAIEDDPAGKPYIYMQYSIPVNIVTNPSFGAHELEIIPGEGDISFYYLFFEGDVAQ